MNVKLAFLFIIGTVFSLHAQKDSVYTSLEDALTVPDKVYKLNLSYQELDSLPESITQLQNLKALNIGGNKFRTTPKVLEKLKNLTHLDYNNMTSLGFSVPMKLPASLRYLNLNHNKLTVVPDFVWSLPNLKILDLSENQLSSISKEIQKLNSLTDLWVEGNPMEKEARKKLQKQLPHCEIGF